MKSNLQKGLLIITTLFLFISNPASAQSVMTLTESFFGSGGVSVNENGEIFVANFGDFLNVANGGAVWKIGLDGSVEMFASGLDGASGNDFDSQGNLIQSNIAGNRISRITPEGVVSDLTSENIFNPVGIAITEGDTIYVANCTFPGSIARITPQGESSILLQDSILSCPNGLTIDDEGVLYACNFNNGSVLRITQDGEVSELASIPGDNNGHLTYANGMLYVVARCANQIYEVSLSGEITLLAGSGVRGNSDGPALDATFSIPNGIAPSPDGSSLYINDATSLVGGCFNGSLNPVVLRVLELTPSSIDEKSGQLPGQFELKQNFPNPFNPETHIGYQLAVASTVKLEIFDLGGRKIRTLIAAEDQAAGSQEVIWNGTNDQGRPVSSAVYLYRLTTRPSNHFFNTAKPQSFTRKMVLMR